MKGPSQTPYRHQFEPEYIGILLLIIEINEKMSELVAIAGTNPPNQPSELID